MGTNREEIIQKLNKIDYKDNPEEFDSLAKKLIDAFVESLPEADKQKAKWQQIKIERELSKFPTPTGRFQRMQEMFIKEVFEDDGGFVDVMLQCSGHRQGNIFSTKKKNELGKLIPLHLVKKNANDNEK